MELQSRLTKFDIQWEVHSVTPPGVRLIHNLFLYFCLFFRRSAARQKKFWGGYASQTPLVRFLGGCGWLRRPRVEKVASTAARSGFRPTAYEIYFETPLYPTNSIGYPTF